ncbi:hypothetical protein [Variovorax paradoxus]|uniref:hypothetical protein n=1 Tax=Variovorax paradoxus TaxID=34073 RepID=UPI001931611D|nr:hypothetical protein INQ48_43750 [Variovorax paradoxus]
MVPTHFEMERRLRNAGVAVRPYPTLDKDLSSSEPALADRLLIAAGTTWENEIERLFAIQLQAEELSNYSSFGQTFDEICAVQGIGVALQILNEDVPHRYTAVYRLAEGRMINIGLVDKLREPRPEFLSEVPIGSSFCQYVLRDGSFFTGDSGLDKRLNGHPYQGVMVSYCGIPVFDNEGKAVGTACHFDVIRHEIAEESIGRLRAAARILSNYFSSGTRAR